jgi:hypothetical protein
VDGGPPVPLAPPEYSYELEVAANYAGTIELSFRLRGLDLPSSPVSISAKPDVAAVVGGSVAAAALALVLLKLAYDGGKRRSCSPLRACAGGKEGGRGAAVAAVGGGGGQSEVRAAAGTGAGGGDVELGERLRSAEGKIRELEAQLAGE